jgi:hypothetical protein
MLEFVFLKGDYFHIFFITHQNIFKNLKTILLEIFLTTTYTFAINFRIHFLLK